MELVVVGTGYVGLVTGTSLAEMGNSVTLIDIDQGKIDGLSQREIPIYEPGLERLVKRNTVEGRLRFTTSLAASMAGANGCFIAVGTPPRPDGSANLDYVLEVAREIGRNLRDYSVIVDKSTVPEGTAESTIPMYWRNSGSSTAVLVVIFVMAAWLSSPRCGRVPDNSYQFLKCSKCKA